MRDIEGDSILVKSWQDSLKQQHLRQAAESQSMDLTLLAKTPMHDRLTFEHSEAIDEKIEERLRRDGPVSLYQGWMEEVEDQVAQHTGGRGPNSPEKSKKASKIPSVRQEGSHAQLHHGNSVHSACETENMSDRHFSEAMTTINDTRK